jgi:nucleotide-binding universal stress UspA family protein
MGFVKETQITVLGVSESDKDIEKISTSMSAIEKKLGSNYHVDRKFRNGDPIKEILTEALEIPYDLVAMGGGGMQLGLLHPKLGSTAGKLARKLHTHFLIARNLPEKITKILVCTGSEIPKSETMKIGGAWIANTNAKVGLLHVHPADNQSASKEPIAPVTKDSEPDWMDQPDVELSIATEQLRNAGVKSEILPHFRFGLVVEEIVNEVNDGAYDLLVIGAHYQPGQDRWQGVLFDDVTDQLLNRTHCSVLII